MAALGTQYETRALAYLLNGSTTGAPAAWALAVGAAVPTASSTVTTWEVGTASGYSCQTMAFPAVAASSQTNTAAVTMGPFSTAVTISGVALKDTSATGGALIFWGSLATAATLTAGESLIFAVGSVNCSLT